MSQKGGRGGKGVSRSEAGAGVIDTPVVNIGPAAGSIASALLLAKEAGVDIATISEAEAEKMFGVKNFMGFFSPKYSKVFLNSDIFGRGNHLANEQLRGFRSHLFSSGHPDSTVHHEIGHAKHYREIKDRMYSKRGRQWHDFRKPFPKLLGRRVGREVSGYAATNKVEFVAEVYAGVKGGQKYSPRIMQYYKRLGGQL